MSSSGRQSRPTPYAFVAGAIWLLLLSACEDGSHRDIGDEINILTRRNDALVGPATGRLVAFRRKAIPQIETALHTAAPTGRLHLIEALGRIGDDQAVPVLRHVAIYDVNLEVRDAAEAVLARWAQEGAGTAVASPSARAVAAQGEIARKRAAGEGPVLWGDAGAPGAPTTVGAPEPVGAPSPSRR
jgi:HEAT repeats